MSEKFPVLEPKHIEFIEQQHIYFVGTAGAQGYVNVSPKGMDTFRVRDAHQVAWLNLTGSGNESAAHVRENGRMTVMFCSFDKHPVILRLYGQATIIHARDSDWGQMTSLFPDYTGARQVFLLNLTMVQTSCGYAVPYLEYRDERPTLDKWADKKGRDGIIEYWGEKNTRSLDDHETGILEGV